MGTLLMYSHRNCLYMKQGSNNAMQRMVSEKNILTVSASTKRVGHSEHDVNI